MKRKVSAQKKVRQDILAIDYDYVSLITAPSQEVLGAAPISIKKKTKCETLPAMPVTPTAVWSSEPVELKSEDHSYHLG